jgi:hypothetical protein
MQELNARRQFLSRIESLEKKSVNLSNGFSSLFKNSNY